MDWILPILMFLAVDFFLFRIVVEWRARCWIDRNYDRRKHPNRTYDRFDRRKENTRTYPRIGLHRPWYVRFWNWSSKEPQ